MTARIPVQPVAAPSGPRLGALTQHNLWTLAALGFLAYYFTVMWHEILGHGLALYLLGAHHFVLTSTSMTSPDFPFDPQHISLGNRFVSAAGAIANLILGTVLYPVLLTLNRKPSHLAIRLFFWLLTALNFYFCFAYPLYSGIFGVADFAMVIESLPHHGVLRWLEVVVGALCCAATTRIFASTFAEFPESLWRLSLVPYAAASLVFCAAGLLIPNGAYLMLISVLPAALMGQSILLFVTPVARRLRAFPPKPNPIAASPVAVACGLVFVVIVLVTARGVRFSLP